MTAAATYIPRLLRSRITRGRYQVGLFRVSDNVSFTPTDEGFYFNTLTVTDSANVPTHFTSANGKETLYVCPDSLLGQAIHKCMLSIL